MLYLRGSTWWVKFKSNGATVRRSTGKTARGAAAKEALQIVAAERRAAPSSGPSRGSGRLITLAAEAIAAAKAKGLSPGEVGATETVWGNLLDHFGEDTSARDVTAEMIAAYEGFRRQAVTRRKVRTKQRDGTYAESFIETPAGVRGQTIRRELGRLRRALRVALSRRWISELPKFPEDIRKDPARPGRKGRVIPMDRALDAISRMPWPASAEYTVALLTNLREAEIHRLEASWVQRAPKGSKVPAFIRVPAEGAKDRTERVTGCPAIVVAALLQRAKEIPSGALFPRSRWQNRRAIKSASIAAGLPYRITLRDMRKTYATVAGATESVAAIQASLGHDDLETTSIYVEAETSRTLAVSAAVERAWKAAKVGTAKGAQKKKRGTAASRSPSENWSARRDLNSRPLAPQASCEDLSTCPHCGGDLREVPKEVRIAGRMAAQGGGTAGDLGELVIPGPDAGDATGRRRA